MENVNVKALEVRQLAIHCNTNLHMYCVGMYILKNFSDFYIDIFISQRSLGCHV